MNAPFTTPLVPTANVDVFDTNDVAAVLSIVDPEPPPVTVVDAIVFTPVSANPTLYAPGNKNPNEYEPSAAVVAVTGEPPTNTGFPDESNNDTVAPATPVTDPDNVAVPDNVAPHCTFVGAETDTDVDTEATGVVTFDESVAEPDALTVIDEAARPMRGPVPLGQTVCAVGRRHNCGASPITLIRALAFNTPEAPSKPTTKFGVWPVISTESADKSNALPVVTATSVQPWIFVPDESCTVNFALVNPVEGVTKVKDAHSAIADVVEQPIRGTDVPPAKVTLFGAIALQPKSPVRIFTVLNTGFEC